MRKSFTYICALSLGLFGCNSLIRTAFEPITAQDPTSSGSNPTFPPVNSLLSSATASYKFPYENFQPAADTSSFQLDSNNNPVVRSTCGVFRSTDHGNTFAPMMLSGIEADPIDLFFDGSNVYISTSVGLYKSTDSGVTFQLILDRTKGQAILNSMPPQLKCVGISLGPAFSVRKVFADGNTILVSTDLGVLRSTDGGVIFAPVTIAIQGYMMPPLQNVTKIHKKGSSIYISADWGGPSAANVFNTYHVGTNEACALNPELPGGAMAVSTDGGATFVPAPGIGTFGIIQNFDFSSTRTHILASNQHHYSSLDGQTFTGSPSTSFSQAPFSYGAATFPLAVTSTRIFATRSPTVPSRSLILIESLNDGLTFADRQIDPQVPSTDLVVTGVYARGSDVYVTSDHGLYISRDGGATFSTRKRFSSDFCTLPWWHYSTVHGFVGDSVFTVFPGFTGLRSSTDQGRRFIADSFPTFARPGIPNGENGIYLSHLANMTSLESSIHFGFYAGGVTTAVSSFDGGKTFQPFAESDARYNGKRIFFLGNSLGAFYVAGDGVDERAQLQSLPQPSTYVGAYSIGGRMIVSRYSAGLIVLKGGQIEHAYPETGGWPKIREYGGAIFAIGSVTMVSFDQGATFQRAPGSPYFADDLIAFGNKVYLISSEMLYESTDGGHSFHPLVGRLE